MFILILAVDASLGCGRLHFDRWRIESSGSVKVRRGLFVFHPPSRFLLDSQV